MLIVCRVLRAITYDDSLAIISYIVQHKCTNNIFNDEMWIDMLKTRVRYLIIRQIILFFFLYLMYQLNLIGY